MEFLVRTGNLLPPDTPDTVRDRLRAEERVRAVQLREAGVLKRLWRVPGRNATFGLYEADDPTALHDALTSLPLWKWMDVRVEALATHRRSGRRTGPPTTWLRAVLALMTRPTSTTVVKRRIRTSPVIRWTPTSQKWAPKL